MLQFVFAWLSGHLARLIKVSILGHCWSRQGVHGIVPQRVPLLLQIHILDEEAEAERLALAAFKNDGWMSLAASIHALALMRNARVVSWQNKLLSIRLRPDRGGVNT